VARADGGAEEGRHRIHPLVTDVAGLLWLANQNCITPHVWTARDPDLMHPDLLVIDLDPSEEDDDALRAATLLVRGA
jgi:bifunctional non-homologous end joining protein LigD